MEVIIGGKKKATTRNTYTQLPITPQIQALQGMVRQETDPSIPYQYAQRRQDLSNSYMNPLGAYTSSAVRDAASRVASDTLSMDEAEAVKDSRYQNKQAEFNRQAVIAGLTQPVNTSSTATQSGGGLLGAIGSAAGFGASLL